MNWLRKGRPVRAAFVAWTSIAPSTGTNERNWTDRPGYSRPQFELDQILLMRFLESWNSASNRDLRLSRSPSVRLAILASRMFTIRMNTIYQTRQSASRRIHVHASYLDGPRGCSSNSHRGCLGRISNGSTVLAKVLLAWPAAVPTIPDQPESSPE